MVAKQTKTSPMKGRDIFDFNSNLFDTSLDFSSYFLLLTKGSWVTKVYSDIRSLYSRSNIINVLILAKLSSVPSVRQIIEGPFADMITCGKDVIYSVKNSSKVDWRQVLLKQCIRCYQQLEAPQIDAKDAHEVPCLIVDDTDIQKRGKCMEFIGKIFSHVAGSYPLGYKSLLLSYWTGKTILHVDFSNHIELRKDGMQGLTKKELKNRYSKDRKAGTYGAQRVSECTEKKPVALIRMLKRALKTPLQARYLLADSWFFNSELVNYIKSTTLDLITRPKMNNWKYELDGKKYTIGELINKYRSHKKRKFSRKLNMYTVSLTVTFQGEEIKLHLYKPKKRGTKWQVLVNTHRSVNALRTYQLYQNRWAIEVSFKELKQHLQFGKCQARDFDGQIADNTICLLTYNLLSSYKCKNEYESLGALFSHIEQSWIKPTIMQKFWSVINRVIETIAEALELEVDKLKKLIISEDKVLKLFNLDAILLTTET